MVRILIHGTIGSIQTDRFRGQNNKGKFKWHSLIINFFTMQLVAMATQTPLCSYMGIPFFFLVCI